jgi:hypothetical protein
MNNHQEIKPNYKGFRTVTGLWCGRLLSVAVCLAWGNINAEDLQALQMWYTTPAYERAVVKILLEEANAIARELQLNEKLPITREDLVEVHISSALISDASGSLGSIGTRSYLYYCGRQGIGSIVRNFGASNEGMREYFAELKKKYRIPLAEINTNAAFNLATQWLSAASFDVPALLRDWPVKVHTSVQGDHFVPFYVVEFGNAGEVHLIEPERALLDLRVSKPGYKKRDKLTVPNRDWLMQQTDDPRMRQMWFTTDAYKEAALDAMLKEVNVVCRQLQLPQKLPVLASDLTEWSIETPFFSEGKGMFGSLSTEAFCFTAFPSNKLGAIKRNFRLKGNEDQFRESIKARYTRPNSLVNTNAAYTLAVRWLKAIGTDVKRMERDCRATVSWWDLGDQFVPLYEVRWTTPTNAMELAASVELLEPEESLIDLWVPEWVPRPGYLNRDPIKVEDRDALLQKTNGPAND